MKFDVLLLFRLQTLDKFLHFPSTKKTLPSGGASFCFFKSPFSTLKGTFRAIAKKKTNKQKTETNKTKLISTHFRRWYLGCDRLLAPECDYYNRGHPNKIDQSDCRKITIHSAIVSSQ